jgi:hypothetical protein
MVEPTGFLPQKGDTFLDLAEILEVAGRREEALTAAREAIAVYEQKEDVVSAARARKVASSLEKQA